MVDELLFRVTYRCNLDCDFCFNKLFAGDQLTAKEEAIDYEEILNFINKMGIKKVYLSGGEPAVRKDLTELIETLTPHVEVIIFTNGLLFKRYSTEELMAMNLKSINYSMSDEDILNLSVDFTSICHKAKIINDNSITKVNAQIMLDSDYFKKKKIIDSSAEINSFKRLFWQPLALPKDHQLYYKTLEGMDETLLANIIRSLRNNSVGEEVEHINIIDQYMQDASRLETCLMGCKYLTLNPDLSISLCPHRYDLEYNINSDLNNLKVANNDCLSLKCICLYSHLERRCRVK